MVPLTFANPANYDAIQEDDRVSVLSLADLAPGKPVRVRLTHSDKTTYEFDANHTFSPAQIEWFKAGSALNVIRRQLQNR